MIWFAWDQLDWDGIAMRQCVAFYLQRRSQWARLWRKGAWRVQMGGRLALGSNLGCNCHEFELSVHINCRKRLLWRALQVTKRFFLKNNNKNLLFHNQFHRTVVTGITWQVGLCHNHQFGSGTVGVKYLLPLVKTGGQKSMKDADKFEIFLKELNSSWAGSQKVAIKYIMPN